MATVQRNNGNVNQPQPQTGGGQPQGSTSPMQRSGQTPQPMARGGGQARSPFGAMRRLMEEMDRMFGDFGFGPSLGGVLAPLERESLWMPTVEVLEKNGQIVVRADLPGLKPEDVRVDVDRGVLTIAGERKQETSEEREGLFHSERSYGSFQRRIALPDDVDPDKIDARFENGVLEVTVPASVRPRGKSIQVKGGKTG